MVPEFPASTPKAMAKLYCAVILVAGWALALATPNPLTDQEKIANCQNITNGQKNTAYQDEDNPCYYTCKGPYDFFGLQVNNPDGLVCGQGKECNDGACLDQRAKDMCKANMQDYTGVSDIGNCFILCSNGDRDQYVMAPKNYPCLPFQPCKSQGACDGKGRCIAVRDEVTANAINFPRANDARAYMDCATRYTNGSQQYKEKNLELTSASSNEFFTCGYTCEFTNTSDQSVVQEGYCFAELTDCTNTTDPDAEEMVCVAGDCQSKAIYDTCVAKGYPPVELNTADGCTSLMCNWRDIFYENLGTKCVDDDHKNGTCDGQGFCVPF